jgi:hypothetical protein
MNFHWLQFWGDLQQGLHPSWHPHVPAGGRLPHAAWRHRQRASAQQLRRSLQIAERWDDHFSPQHSPWMLLNAPDFARWCEACGLLALGDHLKRLVSVRAVERLQIGLDRRTLGRIVEFIRDHAPATSGPLPLDIPTAARLGAHTLQQVCAPRCPRVWSRLSLRFDRASPLCAGAVPPPFVPDIETLARFEKRVFPPAGQTPQCEPFPEDHSWTTSRTLSA